MHKLVNNKWFLSFCVPALARCEANRYFHYTFYSIWALKMLSQASFIQSYKGFFLYLRTFNLTDTVWTLHGRIGVWVCGDKAKSVLRCTLSVNVDFSILPKHTLTCSSVEEGIKWPSHLSHKICKLVMNTHVCFIEWKTVAWKIKHHICYLKFDRRCKIVALNYRGWKISVILVLSVCSSAVSPKPQRLSRQASRFRRGAAVHAMSRLRADVTLKTSRVTDWIPVFWQIIEDSVTRDRAAFCCGVKTPGFSYHSLRIFHQVEEGRD